MNFSLDELQRARLNGTLESLLLSHGQLPMKVLESVLEDVLILQNKLDSIGKVVDEGKYV